MNRRNLLATTLTLSLLALTGRVSAQSYPSKPITIVVPFGPGGTADVVVRAMSDHLRNTLGQPIVIDNRIGAAGRSQRPSSPARRQMATRC